MRMTKNMRTLTSEQVGRWSPELLNISYRYAGSVKTLRLSVDAKSVLVAALMLIVVAAIMFGIDLINGRWDQPPIQPPL